MGNQGPRGQEGEALGLAKRLAEVGKRLTEVAPVAWLERAQALSAQADREGATKRSPKLGEAFPDFALPDVEGREWRSELLRQRGPLVVLIQRGAWCPYCEATLMHYEQALHLFQAQGATVVAISPQAEHLGRQQQQRWKLQVPLLRDEGLAYAERLGLAYRVPSDLQEAYAKLGIPYDEAQGGIRDRLPATGTFLVGEDGRVLAAWASADYTRRPDVGEVLATLRQHRKSGTGPL